MAKSTNPFRWFDSSPEVIRLVMLMYVKYPLSLRNLEDLLAECGNDICHETVRLWWNRFGRMFAAETLYRQRHRIENMFGRLKDWRRIHTRYDRCAHTFMSAIAIAATVIFWL